MLKFNANKRESNKKLWMVSSSAGASKQVAFRAPRRREYPLNPRLRLTRRFAAWPRCNPCCLSILWQWALFPYLRKRISSALLAWSDCIIQRPATETCFRSIIDVRECVMRTDGRNEPSRGSPAETSVCVSLAADVSVCQEEEWRRWKCDYFSILTLLPKRFPSKASTGHRSSVFEIRLRILSSFKEDRRQI